MSSSLPILKFLFRDDWKVLTECLKGNPEILSEEMPSVNDLVSYISGSDASLVFTALWKKEDIPLISNFIKLQKKIAAGTIVKIVIINFSGDREFEKQLMKLGIQEIIDPKINAKALRFKIDFMIKSLNAQIKQNQTADPSRNFKTAENKLTDERLLDQQPNWIEPLSHPDDIWLNKNKTDCKKVLGKWLTKLMGPGPFVGQWVSTKSNRWAFEIRDGKDLFLKGQGFWEFSGIQKPEFIAKENAWFFAGEQFELAYVEEGKRFIRMTVQDNALNICKNSQPAKAKEELIIETFDKELFFKKYSDRLKDLEGKGKTDILSSGPLSGNTSTDQITTYYEYRPVTSIDEARSRRQQDPELDDLTASAKHISILVSRSEKIECNLDDYFEDNIYLETDSTKIKVGEKCFLFLVFKYKEKESKLKLDGVIKSYEAGYVTFQVSAKEVKEFETFKILFQERQKNVDLFLNRARGLA